MQFTLEPLGIGKINIWKGKKLCLPTPPPSPSPRPPITSKLGLGTRPCSVSLPPTGYARPDGEIFPTGRRLRRLRPRRDDGGRGPMTNRPSADRFLRAHAAAEQCGRHAFATGGRLAASSHFVTPNSIKRGSTRGSATENGCPFSDVCLALQSGVWSLKRMSFLTRPRKYTES